MKSGIHIYASGSGALSFVRVDTQGKACAPHTITENEAVQALIDKKDTYDDYWLVMQYGEPMLIPDISYNKETGIASFSGQLYHKVNGHWFSAAFESTEWHRVYNMGILSNLNFYERNTQLYAKENGHALR